MDLLNSFKDLSLMNRAQVVNAFAPGHHLGLQGVYEDKQWLLTGGVHFQKSMTLGNKENSDSNLQKGQNEGYSLPGSYYNPAFHQAANKMIVRRSRKRIRRQNHDSGLRLAVYILPETSTDHSNRQVLLPSTECYSHP